jgi:hypothetical protein
MLLLAAALALASVSVATAGGDPGQNTVRP